jgi:sugar phosphate isomerase/epimerase
VQRPIRFTRRGLINYPAFVAALQQIGYTGHIAYEFCHPCLGENHEWQGLAEVERQVALACRYMTKLIG